MFKMRKIMTLCIALIFLGIAGCVGIIDQLLLVRAEIDPSSDTPIDQCKVRFVDPNGVVLQEDNMTKSGRAGFLNPPRHGEFFVSLHCLGSHTAIQKGPYFFEKDHIVELGKITIP